MSRLVHGCPDETLLLRELSSLAITILDPRTITYTYTENVLKRCHMTIAKIQVKSVPRQAYRTRSQDHKKQRETESKFRPHILKVKHQYLSYAHMFYLVLNFGSLRTCAFYI